MGAIMSRIQALRTAKVEEFEVSEKECKQIRSRFYSWNKDNAWYRYRSLYEDGILMVFRLPKRRFIS